MRNNWSLLPKAYVYWHQKQQFLLDQDRYNNWTMFAVEEGVFQFEIGAHRGEAFFGDIVVCPPGLVFHRKTVEPLTFHFVQFTWDVEPTKEQAEQMTGKITFIDTERLASTYRYIRSLNLTAGQEQSGNRIRHLLEDIWWLYGQESGKADRNREEEADDQMQYAQQWLLAHAFEPLSISKLSDLLGISAVQLTRKYKRSFHMTPSDYVTGLRMDRACSLLEETTLTLDRIAQQCGYENGFYLSRVFRSRKGLSPSVYRKLYQV
ncbi:MULTISPECIES: AraC family transcriptional regulator [unclassified Paenibacillus]|uniref:AraC family transcriptional regulator n=1 Tax=unclassified Paenibacillus TaxID=185978 RepID=UPI002F40B0F5